MLTVLADGLFGVVPWSIVAILVVVAIGLFLIRAAFTLIKVLIVVAIGVAIYLGVRYLLNM
ncbi:MAG TPA: hypothetical protein VM286_04640 [Candidatus Thermoplasmatota archaeon]|nr:hypothetical protein [Candidatus Thermoplasmatota archaeon]